MSNLILCRHCGGAVASSARICPHCGGKDPTKKGQIISLLAVLGLIVLCLAIALIFI